MQLVAIKQQVRRQQAAVIGCLEKKEAQWRRQGMCRSR